MSVGSRQVGPVFVSSSQQSSTPEQQALPQHSAPLAQLASHGIGVHTERLQYCPAAHGLPQPPQF